MSFSACMREPVGAHLWEQSLLAMNDNAALQLDRVACIASKLCSHRLPPQRTSTLIQDLPE
nr:hypothetical protein C1892_13080 [Pseudomonas sp. MPBD7-1]